jgi:hypothetical protein
MTSKRMKLLLTGLSKLSYDALPRGVGLKTVIEAQEEGWINVHGKFHRRNIQCKLTREGHEAANDLAGELGQVSPR